MGYLIRRVHYKPKPFFIGILTRGHTLCTGCQPSSLNLSTWQELFSKDMFDEYFSPNSIATITWSMILVFWFQDFNEPGVSLPFSRVSICICLYLPYVGYLYLYLYMPYAGYFYLFLYLFVFALCLYLHWFVFALCWVFVSICIFLKPGICIFIYLYLPYTGYLYLCLYLFVFTLCRVFTFVFVFALCSVFSPDFQVVTVSIVWNFLALKLSHCQCHIDITGNDNGSDHKQGK